MIDFEDAMLRMAAEIVELDSHKGLPPREGWEQEISQIFTFTVGLVTARMLGEIDQFSDQEVLDWIDMIGEFSYKMTFYHLDLRPDWYMAIEFMLKNISQ
jgi:hypothetical protein